MTSRMRVIRSASIRRRELWGATTPQMPHIRSISSVGPTAAGLDNPLTGFLPAAYPSLPRPRDERRTASSQRSAVDHHELRDPARHSTQPYDPAVGLNAFALHRSTAADASGSDA